MKMFSSEEQKNIDFIRVSACFRLEKILKKQGVLVAKKFIKKNKIQRYFLCTNQKNENLKYCLEFFLPAETKFSIKDRGYSNKKVDGDFYVLSYPGIRDHRFFAFSESEMEEILLESDVGIISLSEFVKKCRRVWE